MYPEPPELPEMLRARHKLKLENLNPDPDS
jgi:hypothetical protein